MNVLIKGVTKDYIVNDIFRWARYGANNSMIGKNLKVVEVPDLQECICCKECSCENWDIEKNAPECILKIFGEMN